MDIRARTLIAFTPLVVLLVSMAVALPIIEQLDQDLLEEQISSTNDLTETQTMGINLLLEYVAVNQIARATLNPDSERYTQPHREIAQLLARHIGFTHPSEDLDKQAVTIYAEISARYEQIVTFAQNENLAAAQQLYDDPKTFSLLNKMLTMNSGSRDSALTAINLTSSRAETAQRHAFETITVALVSGILITIGLSWTLVSQIIRPIERITADAEHYASGDRSGQLSPVSNIGQLRRLRNSFQRLLDANTARQARIQQSLDELNEQMAREEHLRETVQALSVPVVPLQEGMLLLPLIGHLDDRRTSELTHGLLEAIHRSRARAVVLDITGLADLDAAGALALRQTIDAARLLGCQIYLVGVRSSQAITLTESHLAEADIIIARDIPSVLARTRAMV
ncbi:STAS domain-containing protein [Chloroflexales bacterium ZM16-3]|nr:STAS domain-containing protein [Chloroflexales bacterium ZM16-3]